MTRVADRTPTTDSPLLFPSLSPYKGTVAYGAEAKHSVCVTNLCASAHPPVEARRLPLIVASAAVVFETWSLPEPDVPGLS